MGLITVEDIIKATGGKLLSRKADAFSGVCIDSRKIKEGELFVPLAGSRADGHTFLPEAMKQGYGAIVSIQPAEARQDRTIILVRDTLKALQDTAHFLRLKSEASVTAVTGTNGKTTTKELIAAILSRKYRVLKNTGNLNNHIGLPLSLTNLTKEHQAVVLEMGASGPGEIKQLCGIAAPDYGVLTNIGYAHLAGFGDLETVRSTKLEMLGFVETAVVNADDGFMMEGIGNSGFRGKLVRYSAKGPADVYASDIRLHEKGSSFRMHFREGGYADIEAGISGMFNVLNILAAASAGYLMKADIEDIKTAVASFTGVPMRLELSNIKGINIISDMYNANPASMSGAVRELARIKKTRAIAVLGDMLELGAYAEEAHRNIGRLLSELGIEIFIAVGPLMETASSEFQGSIYTAANATEAGRILRELWREGDTVLIKGSRGMGMEKVMEEQCCTV